MTGVDKVATVATRRMGTVGVKELKNRLTHYLRRAKDGEEVVVTERGQPIALIQSIRSAQPAQSLEAQLARLAAQGLVTLPTRRPRAKLPRARIGGRPISETILDDRR